jgi:hypothetical protein
MTSAPEINSSTAVAALTFPRNAARVSAAPRLAAVPISCPTAFVAIATRCAIVLHLSLTAFAWYFTAAPKDLACVEIADSCG